MNIAEKGKNLIVSKKNKNIARRIRKDKDYYLLILPALLWVIIFKYVPMYGIQIAFRNFKFSSGITGSTWVGLRNFLDFFNGHYFWTLIKNTLVLSLYSLATFPLPIIAAFIINELRGKFKNITQTILYAPHFISTVVLVGMMSILFSPSMGVVNMLLEAIGLERVYFMGDPDIFRHLYVWSGAWQGVGWGAIVYIAALAGVDPALHEAASIDGATRIQRIIHINLPCIMPTIIIMLILRVGSIASVGYEKVYLMQNSLNIDVSEIISTYVYKRGIINTNYSFSTAVDLFNNVVNVIMLLLSNAISKKYSETSLF